jgi:hypothetical protein
MQTVVSCGGGLSTVVFVGGLLAAAIVVGQRAFRARVAAMTAVGRQLGLRFSLSTERPPVPPSLASGVAAAGRGTFVLEGPLERREASVFNFTIGAGKSARTQTVVTLGTPGRPIPAFLLTPESFVDKLAATMGGQDLDFDDDAEFSKAFRLRGDEAALRQLLGPGVRSRVRALALSERVRVEGWGESISIWKPDERLEPGRVAARVRLAAELAGLFGR